MAENITREQARAQAWDVLLAKARAAQDADPKAAAAAKTLLHDPAWSAAIEAGVKAPALAGTGEESPAADLADDGMPIGYTRVPWQVVYPGYIDGKLAFGVPVDEERTLKEGTLIIEDIRWGSAAAI